MPLPKTLARMNRVFTNRIMRPLALVAPGFGVLHHQGRRTGLEYRTPLNVFRDGDRLIVALTYGDDVDWLKNARVAGGAHFTMGGHVVPVGSPVDISSQEALEILPGPVRTVLRRLGVTGFVAFRVMD